MCSLTNILKNIFSSRNPFGLCREDKLTYKVSTIIFAFFSLLAIMYVSTYITLQIIIMSNDNFNIYGNEFMLAYSCASNGSNNFVENILCNIFINVLSIY